LYEALQKKKIIGTPAYKACHHRRTQKDNKKTDSVLTANAAIKAKISREPAVDSTESNREADRTPKSS
jgi:hypothetical protein